MSINILQDWFRKGDQAMRSQNHFEAFIYLWISWVIGCRIFLRYNANVDLTKNRTDRDDIVEWCKLNTLNVKGIIELNHETLHHLGQRRGSKYGNPIVDASRTLTVYFSRLRQYFRGEYEYKKENDLAADFAELLNKIRNNLFHGEKTYSEKSDRELIVTVLPTLHALAKETVEYTKFL